MIGAKRKLAQIARGTWIISAFVATAVVCVAAPIDPSEPLVTRQPVNSIYPPQALPTRQLPANMHSTSQNLLAPFMSRSEVAEDVPLRLNNNLPQTIPADFSGWWEARTVRPSHPSSILVDIDSLLQNALLYSPFVRAVATEPGIRDTFLAEESAAFDWRSFLESAYDDFNDPVGNDLTTGNNQNRFVDKNWRFRGGVKRKNPLGGQLELAQKLGAQSNNSRFLNPNPQGTARLELNYTHPLLNGGGRAYNRSQIVLAQIDSDASRDELVNQLQEHLLQVTVAYWDLYRARTRLLQREMLLQAARRIQEKIEGREQVDALYRQVLRARAAVAKRESEIGRATAEIDNSEAQLRVLVNDPALVTTAELIPLATPFRSPVNVSMSDSLTTALTNRRDISQAIRTINAASVQLGIAKRDLLPRLDLLMKTYIAGLEGDARVFPAWSNQFNEGRPGFSVGFLWEFPKGNRVAKARERRQYLQIQRASSEFESTVTTSLTEVEIAVREVMTTYNEMLGRFQAMLAAVNETAYLSDRYELLPDINDSAILLLEDLLDAQERQADEEAAFVDAEVNYSISLIGLRKSMGTLLMANLYGCEAPRMNDRQPKIFHELQRQPVQIDGGLQPEFVPPPPAESEPLPTFPLDLPRTDSGAGPSVGRIPLPIVMQTRASNELSAAAPIKVFPRVDPVQIKW